MSQPLSQQLRDSRPRRAWVSMLLISGAAALLAPGHAGAQAPAQAPAKLDISARLVPASASFYHASLRNREQYDALVKSRAFAALRDLPAVQSAWQAAEFFLGMPGGPRDLFDQFTQDPANRELLDLLAEAVSEEYFLTGGASTADFLVLLERINNANRLAPLAGLFGVGNLGGPAAVQANLAVPKALLANRDLIKAPDLVIGFKIRDAKRARAQIDRLEKVLGALAEQEPLLQGRLKRVAVRGSDFLTFKLDGGMIPWESFPLEALAEEPGQFDPLVEKLKATTLTLSLGVRDGYILLSVGETTAPVEALGTGKDRLIDRPEFRPLAKHADKRLTTVSYTSKSYRARTEGGAADVESFLSMVRDNLPPGAVPAKLRQKLDKQFREAAKELRAEDAVGAEFSLSFLTGSGYESFTYDWSTQAGLDDSKPLALLNHVGGTPLLAVVSRSKTDRESYAELVEFVKIVGSYADEWIAAQPEDLQREYKRWNEALRPLLGRLDEATAKLLLPALADGQAALVLDAKWKSAQWHRELPPAAAPLPMLEIGFVFGVSDPPLLEKAVKTYGGIVEDLFAKAGELLPDVGVPEFKFPQPQTKVTPPGKVFTWRLPDALGLDAQVAPSLGLGQKVGVAAASAEHAERLLKATPLKAESRVLRQALRGPLAGATHFDWAGLVDAAAPWVEYTANTISRTQTGADAPEETMRQVRTVLAVLKCFRGAASIQYFQDGALVTQSESMFRDLAPPGGE